jgi:hypothetical protein
MEGRKLQKVGNISHGSHSSDKSFALAIISALALYSPAISAGDMSSQVPGRRASNLRAFASSAPACFWACSHGPSASGFIAPVRPMLLRSHISASSFATRVTFEHGPNIDTVGAVLGFKNANGLRRRGLQTILASSQSSTTSTGRSVGIDLGTTNSAVAVVIDGKPVIIRCLVFYYFLDLLSNVRILSTVALMVRKNVQKQNGCPHHSLCCLLPAS